MQRTGHYAASFLRFAEESLGTPLVTRNQQQSTTEAFGQPRHAKFLTASPPNEHVQFPNNFGGLPEVIVTGRANAGKSTLLNAVMNRKDLAHTSKKPGHTNCLNYYSVGGFVLVDSPGYGSRGLPEWGRLLERYLRERKELRRLYLILNIKHELSAVDEQMLTHISSVSLSASGAPKFGIQILFSKADDVKDFAKLKETCIRTHQALEKSVPLAVVSPPILTSAREKKGIELLKRDITMACGLMKETPA